MWKDKNIGEQIERIGDQHVNVDKNCFQTLDCHAMRGARVHIVQLNVRPGSRGSGICRDGPLVIADDLMAWNISKDRIVHREVVSSERVQAPPTTMEFMKAKRSGQASYSKFINDGKWEGYKPPPLPPK